MSQYRGCQRIFVIATLLLTVTTSKQQKTSGLLLKSIATPSPSRIQSGTLIVLQFSVDVKLCIFVSNPQALDWCPFQRNVLASGGGTADRHIRFWNVGSGNCLSSIDTHSQVNY